MSATPSTQVHAVVDQPTVPLQSAPRERREDDPRAAKCKSRLKWPPQSKSKIRNPNRAVEPRRVATAAHSLSLVGCGIASIICKQRMWKSPSRPP